MATIEVKSVPRCKDATPENCIHTLVVNGYALGTYYGGKEKKYENPKKWARQQIRKRLPVLRRNIARLEKELAAHRKELNAIDEYIF